MEKLFLALRKMFFLHKSSMKKFTQMDRLLPVFMVYQMYISWSVLPGADPEGISVEISPRDANGDSCF